VSAESAVSANPFFGPAAMTGKPTRLPKDRKFSQARLTNREENRAGFVSAESAVSADTFTRLATSALAINREAGAESAPRLEQERPFARRTPTPKDDRGRICVCRVSSVTP